MRLNHAVFLVLGTISLAGCEAANGFGNRYGPDPAMPTTLVNASADHADNIMARLKASANCPPGTENSSECNYATTLVGFNFVDEQCDAYLRELFALDKERDRLKNAIGSAGLLTNAILAVSPASKVTMAIAAQAFGLSSSYVDVLADSYLYQKDAGVVFTVVATLQAQFRDNIYKAYADNKLFINNDPQSYSFIRGYLRLCMPPTIESKITEALAGASARLPPKGSGPGTLGNPELSTNQPAL